MGFSPNQATKVQKIFVPQATLQKKLENNGFFGFVAGEFRPDEKAKRPGEWPPVVMCGFGNDVADVRDVTDITDVMDVTDVVD